MLAKGFYTKLAAGNLLRNKRMYGPYCVATALMSGMFFIILNLIFSQSIANLSYGVTVQAMFIVGIFVMTLFTIGYMLYINSFLIKRRKKEFGLYGVLGMEKRHVARVILLEGLFLGGASLLLGLAGGLVFGRVAFMLLMNMLDTAKGSFFAIDGTAILATVLIFGAIFGISTVYNLNQVRLASPVDLLKGSQPGEKKVRSAPIVTLVGVILLGIAYYIAITIDVPSLALMLFWPAVILVIIATWLLFTGGSAFVLKRLQANKRIYYKPGNFITISGLGHRMKQNAAGLANICILCSMVMVTVSCCFALYTGQDYILLQQNPNDIVFDYRFEDPVREAAVTQQTLAAAQALSLEQGISIESTTQYRYTQQRIVYQDGKLYYRDKDGSYPGAESLPVTANMTAEIILLEDFNAVSGQSQTLAEGEAFVLSEFSQAEALKTIPMEDGNLSVKAHLRGTPFTHGKNSDYQLGLFFVVPDMQTADRLTRAMNPTVSGANMLRALVLNIDADHETGYAYANALRDTFRALCGAAFEASGESGNFFTRSIYTNRVESYGLYGGILFLGVFFAVLFLINTVLILYFKQVSEGFDDCERFEILQKVGLSDVEVRTTINRQMLIVFLLPLLMALVHIAAASNMIRQMLGTFMLTDFTLTMTCIAVTALLFIVVYLVAYRMTARTYYRLVKW